MLRECFGTPIIPIIWKSLLNILLYKGDIALTWAAETLIGFVNNHVYDNVAFFGVTLCALFMWKWANSFAVTSLYTAKTMFCTLTHCVDIYKYKKTRVPSSRLT